MVAVPAVVAADDDHDAKQNRKVEWQQLTPAQRDVLEPMREHWDKLPPGRQQALTRGAERWESMSPEQREEIRQRAERWKSLPPEERERMKERYDRFKSLPPEEQDRLRQAGARTGALSATAACLARLSRERISASRLSTLASKVSRALSSNSVICSFMSITTHHQAAHATFRGRENNAS